VTSRAADLLADTGGRIPPGEVLVALSGGADSAVLAWVATEANGRDAVRALHVNHRQPASDGLELAARAIASRLSIPIRVVEVEIGSGASFENRARQARLAALEAAAGDDRLVLIGHQRDDVVETVIAHLARGAGARGLSGIAERRGRLVRPLIDVDRSVVRAVADELELPYADDPTNLDTTFRRNAIRSRVVPVLNEVTGVGVNERIARAARHLAADDAALEAEADLVPIRDGYRGAMLIPAAPLMVVSLPVAARVVQRAFRRLEPPYGATADEVAAVLAIAGGKARRSGLSRDLVADREGALISIYRVGEEAAASTPELIDAEPSHFITYGPVRLHLSTGPQSPSLGRIAAHLKAGGPYAVRAAEKGERLEIEGGSKLVRDAMSETGIPRRLRSEWPVVARDGRIAWIAGSRLAPWAKADPGTPDAMTLRMERIAL
jgi:tRNA(Ile)-lysidine synthase